MALSAFLKFMAGKGFTFYFRGLAAKAASAFLKVIGSRGDVLLTVLYSSFSNNLSITLSTTFTSG
jgi:hypothetical protein